MEINSVVGMLELLKAARKTAIRDELAYRYKGKRKEGAWMEWKESECRRIYCRSYELMCLRDRYRNTPIRIPSSRGGNIIEN